MLENTYKYDKCYMHFLVIKSRRDEKEGNISELL